MAYRTIRLLGGMTVLVAVCVLHGEPLAVTDSTDSDPKKLALLVGCTRYVHLENKRWLEGPTNDVKLFSRVLERFGFDSQDMTKLAGWPADPSERPTRANIVAAFKKLVQVAGPEDQIVILLAGHGSQQPADDDPSDIERDGLDEIFLPADVKGWNGETGEVKNSITDDEIRGWLAAIQSKGAFVWIVIDSCHSGTMTRKVTLERVRRVPPDVLVPEELLRAARERHRARVASARPPALDLPPSSERVVALFAAQPDEETPEKRLPRSNSPYHGLFTFTLSNVLLSSSSAMTYRELVESVATTYRALGRRSDTVPMLEGGAADREVLGLAEWPGRPRLVLGSKDRDDPTKFRLNAGALHGLREGSVLAVYPPPGGKDANEIVGHARVESVNALESLITPISYADMSAPEPSQLVSGSRCAVVYVDYGEMRTRVVLQSQTGTTDSQVVTYATGNGPSDLQRVLKDLSHAGRGLIERVDSPEIADWVVRAVGSDVLLVPALGWLMENRAARYGSGIPPPQFVFERKSFSKQAAPVLKRIAQATNLLRLAHEDATAYRSAGALDVDLELLLKATDGVMRPMPFGPRGRVLVPGDKIAFELTNYSRFAVDVTVLFVDSGIGIECFFPKGQQNRFAPGESAKIQGTIDDKTLGAEQIVMIAVRADGLQKDFCFLEQPTLRQRKTRAPSVRKSPLESILLRATYGKGELRGVNIAGTEDYTIRLLAWTVVPRERAAVHFGRRDVRCRSRVMGPPE